MLKIRRGSHGSPKALQPAAAKTIQFLAALAFKALQEPFRPRERLHPRNLLRHLCGGLKIQLVPLGESGTAVQPFNPSNQAGARGAGSSRIPRTHSACRRSTCRAPRCPCRSAARSPSMMPPGRRGRCAACPRCVLRASRSIQVIISTSLLGRPRELFSAAGASSKILRSAVLIGCAIVRRPSSSAAQLTRISTRPKSLNAGATAALTAASSPASATYPFRRRFVARAISAAAVSSAVRSRAIKATSTLSLASCHATALPMPRSPPVTMATLS